MEAAVFQASFLLSMHLHGRPSGDARTRAHFSILDSGFDSDSCLSIALGSQNGGI